MPESFERGALTEAVFYLLLSLHHPMHGYALMQNIERMTEGRVVLGAGTLYGALNALEKKAWIKAIPGGAGSRKKEYLITDIGREVYLIELDRLNELLKNDKKERIAK